MIRFALAVCLLVSAQAQAQQTTLDFEPAAEPLSCLISVRPEHKLPDYPSDAAAGASAVVRVKLKFASNDTGPQVEIAFNSGGEAFAAAVRAHVAHYRLPCLRPDRTFAGVQEFQFLVKQTRPTVLPSIARDEYDWWDSLTPECRAGVEKAPPVEFPMTSQVTGPVQLSLVLVRMKFVAPDKPPVVEVLFDGGQGRLTNAVLSSVSTYRLPCMRPDEGPFTTQQSFAFRLEDQKVPQLKPELTLNEFLSLVKGMDQQRVRFDFTTMGCPFKLAIRPFQPYSKNSVRELGVGDAGRREFIEWLRSVTLDLPVKIQRTALGEASTVSVPCAVLDFS